MPNRFEIRNFSLDSFYHIFNRGVEKRNIFIDEQDYAIFLHLLKYYLSPGDKDIKHPLVGLQGYQLVRPRPLTTLFGCVELHAYCLMPNHFHLLVRQLTEGGVTLLLRKVSTTYSMYFNKRYKRVGHLFQGKYKAVLVDQDPYILHLSMYIHTNPLDSNLKNSNQSLTSSELVNYPYSSYAYYLGRKQAIWLRTDFILKYFQNKNQLPFLKNQISYKSFVEGGFDSKGLLGRLVIE